MSQCERCMLSATGQECRHFAMVAHRVSARVQALCRSATGVGMFWQRDDHDENIVLEHYWSRVEFFKYRGLWGPTKGYSVPPAAREIK
jgi:hypothetical protein